MRNVKLNKIADKSIFEKPMTLLAADAKASGGVQGSGGTLVIEHTSDNNLMTFRFKNKDVKMQVAEEDFDLNGRKLRAGAFIIPNANRTGLEPQLKDLGLSAWAVAAAPPVKTHALTIPRIGYIHSWSRTQDEGWVRAALDHYSVPFTYFADQKLKEGNLRSKYDVIVFPHVGGTSASMINGIAMTGTAPIPYKKTEQTPNLGGVDESDDIRGGMGLEGLQELAKFVQQGGTLITEGSTATLMAEYNLAGGVTVEHPAELFARGSILRGVFSDLKSPIAYGYDGKDLPVYFNQDPVLNAAAPLDLVAGSAAAVAVAAERLPAPSTAVRARTLHPMPYPSTPHRSTPATHRRQRRPPREADAEDAAARGARCGRCLGTRRGGGRGRLRCGHRTAPPRSAPFPGQHE